MTKTKKEKIFYINSKEVLGRAIRAISGLEVRAKDPYAIKVYIDAEDRSAKQNRLSFLLYKELGVATGYGATQERYRCKLMYSLPLLLGDAEFYQFYNNTMLILPYNEQLDCMEFVPTTSRLSMKQFADYLNTIYTESADQGIILSKPEDLYYSALMITKE